MLDLSGEKLFASTLALWSVSESVAVHAQRNQIYFVVISCSTPELQMMDLQIFSASAGLTSPAIALKHLAMQ